MLPLRVFGILTRRWEVEEILCVHVLAGVAGSSSGFACDVLEEVVTLGAAF